MLTNIIEKRDVSVVPASAWRALGGISSTSGITVTPSTAITFSAVFAAHKILAESVAMLPLFLMRRTASGKSPATDMSLYGVLHDVANPEMDAYLVRETMTASMVGRGFAIGIIDYDVDGNITALWPVPPSRVYEITRNEQNELVYRIIMQNGQVYTYPSWRILHLRGMGPDGINAYSPITLQRQGIGLALAAEMYGASYFGNGGTPGGILKRPAGVPPLKEDSATRLINSWNDAHQGADRANKVALLEEGMEYQAIQISPEDAQFLQTREFQVEEIARWYRIPPPMLAMTDKTSTYASVEAFGLQFVIYTLYPWLVRWEKAISAQMLYENQRPYLFAEHLMTAFLRGDTPARYTAYGQARQWGWMSVNDIRALENMNGIGSSGDVYLTPANMMPAGKERDLRQACLPGLADAINRALKREVNDVRGAVTKLLRKKGAEAFADWLSDFYQEHQEFMVRQITPASLTLAEIASGDEREMTERVEGSLRLFALRRASQAQQQIRDAMNEADPAGAVEALLDQWNDDFGNRLAKMELSRQVAFYGSKGVIHEQETS